MKVKPNMDDNLIVARGFVLLKLLFVLDPGWLVVMDVVLTPIFMNLPL